MELFKEHIEKTEKDNQLLPKTLTCSACQKEILAPMVHLGDSTCMYCGAYFRMPASKRVAMIADENTFVEADSDLKSADPLKFPHYAEKLEKARKATGLKDAIITGVCEIEGFSCGIGVMDSYFMMGSMGETVGLKITNLVETCIEKKRPLVIFSASGGARMQEGMISLLQMTRTTIAINKLGDDGLPFISVLTDPTTGGVTASFAMQGDVILAEPKALIGFAGPRVIQQTVKDVLPDEFQTAEYLFDKGMIDAIVPRHEMKQAIGRLLALHQPCEDK